MPKNSIVYENLKIWIYTCQLLGFFSYRNNSRKFTKNRHHLIDTFRCALLYLGNEIYFSGFKSKYNYFGWILVAVDFIFTLIWTILFIRNNPRLIATYKLFDTFDDAFKKITKMDFNQKPCFKNKTVILAFVLFIMDYFSMFYCVLYLRGNITFSCITAISRAIQRSVMAIFLIGYLYLLHSIQIRFKKLQDLWMLNVESKVGNVYKNFQMINDMNDIKSLYIHLTDIVESMNLCFGSRLAVMFAQVFYLILLYFYMICTGLPVIIFLVPFYISVIFFVTLCAQNLYESVSM